MKKPIFMLTLAVLFLTAFSFAQTPTYTVSYLVIGGGGGGGGDGGYWGGGGGGGGYDSGSTTLSYGAYTVTLVPGVHMGYLVLMEAHLLWQEAVFLYRYQAAAAVDIIAVMRVYREVRAAVADITAQGVQEPRDKVIAAAAAPQVVRMMAAAAEVPVVPGMRAEHQLHRVAMEVLVWPVL